MRSCIFGRQSILHCHSVNAGCSFVGLYPLIGSVQIISVQNSFKQVCTVRFFDFPSVNTPRSRILFVFRTIPLRAAPVSKVFCFLHTDLLPPFLRTYDCSALPGLPVLWPLLTYHSSLLLRLGYLLLIALSGLRLLRRPYRL